MTKPIDGRVGRRVEIERGKVHAPIPSAKQLEICSHAVGQIVGDHNSSARGALTYVRCQVRLVHGAYC